jgi:MFS family permease
MGDPPSTPLSLRPSWVRFGVLGFACSLALITYLDRICIARVSEDMQQDLFFNDVQMGWVFNAFTLGYLLFEVPSGWMGDAWGARRVLTRIVLWWSLFTALTGMIWPFTLGGLGWLGLVNGGFLLLLLVRFLFGCGEAGAFPNLTRVVGSWFPFGERGVTLGTIWTSARLGGAVAPLIIGRLTVALGGWRPAFWFLGGLGVLWCVFFFRWYRNSPEEKPECNEAERELIRAGPYSWKDDKTSNHALPPWRNILGSANLWLLCLSGGGISFSWYFFVTWQLRFLKEVHQLQGATAEVLSGLPLLIGAAGCFLGGKLMDVLTRRLGRRWGRSSLGVVGLLAAGFCFLGAGLTSEAWLSVVLLCLTTFFNDLTVPLHWGVSTDIGGRFSGTVSGIMNMMAGFGPFISQPLMPVWWHAWGWPVMMAILAGVWLVAAACWLRIDASEPLVPEPAAAGDTRAQILDAFERTAAEKPPEAEGPGETHIQK